MKCFSPGTRHILTYLVFLLVVLSGSSTVFAQEGEVQPRAVAITFDDLPASMGQNDTVRFQRILQKLLDQIVAEEIPAIGFVNETKLYDQDTLVPERVALLQHWVEAGLELGNHSFSHPSLHRVSLEKYQKDVMNGEGVIRELAEKRGMPLRYFRHPYLHTGRDLETKEGLEDFLEQQGYQVAPVTIDNAEWIYAKAYALAVDREDRDLAEDIAADYLRYMNDVFAYYEQQSTALLGYELPQILLLHANQLNADYLNRLMEMIRLRGYRIITLQQALQDPAYQGEDTYTGPGGITWLHRWALTAGKKGAFFKGEPEPPSFIMVAAEMNDR